MTPDKTQAQALAEIGHEPLSAKTTLRSTPSFKDRLEQAARECAMTPSDWLRAVVTAAVELHEERERMVAAGLDPDVDTPLDDIAAEALDEPEEPDPADPDYAEKVEAAAAVLRAETPPPPPAPAEERPSPRECVHPLTRRHGPRCGVCGAMVGQVRSARASGRYLGTIR